MARRWALFSAQIPLARPRGRCSAIAGLEGPSPGDAVVKVDDSAAGASLIEQFKIETPVPGKGGFAAPERQWPEEQVTLVHQA